MSLLVLATLTIISIGQCEQVVATPVPDMFEPNDSIAKAITPGTYYLSIDNNIDQDLFNISLTLGDKITITVSDYLGDNITLNIFNSSDVIQQLEITPPATGTIVHTAQYTGNLGIYTRDSNTRHSGNYTLTIAVESAKRPGDGTNDGIAGYEIPFLIASVGIGSVAILASLKWKNRRSTTK